MGQQGKDGLKMAQREQQYGHPDAARTGWLCTLVDTFEQTAKLGKIRCDEQLLSEMHARLARPAFPRECKLAVQRQH